MNFDIKKIINIKKKKTFKKEYFQINPDKYWNFLLIMFFVLILAGGGFGYFTFNSFDNTLDTNNSNSNNTNYNPKQKEDILNLINYFSVREKKTIEILENKNLPVIDPSL